MAVFRVYYAGALEAAMRKDIGFRVITTQGLNDFWSGSDLGSGRRESMFLLSSGAAEELQCHSMLAKPRALYSRLKP